MVGYLFCELSNANLFVFINNAVRLLDCSVNKKNMSPNDGENEGNNTSSVHINNNSGANLYNWTKGEQWDTLLLPQILSWYDLFYSS